ncbi:hypothetical protein M3J09_011868 [Ascochyta lentis]
MSTGAYRRQLNGKPSTNSPPNLLADNNKRLPRRCGCIPAPRRILNAFGLLHAHAYAADLHKHGAEGPPRLRLA